MKKIFLVFFLILTSFLSAQTKYMIYFKDKGELPSKVLGKLEAVQKEAESLLSARSIARREKTMGKGGVLTFEDLPLSLDYVNFIESYGVKIENKLKWFNAVSAYLTGAQVDQLKNLPFVDRVSPVKIFKSSSGPDKNLNKFLSVPSTSDYGLSFGQLNLSDIPAVQAKGITGSGIVIGILDNGFYWREQEALQTRNVLAEYNFVFHTFSTQQQPGDAASSGTHGTLVFSVIGGYKEGTMIGAAYNAAFVLAKTEDDRSESHIEEDNYAAALQWMDSLGVDLTTSSLGYNTFDDTTYSYTYKDMDGKTTIITKAAELAYQRGILVLNAAGNEGNKPWRYVDAPADGFHVIAVGAVDLTKTVAAFSSRGPTYDGRIKPDISADGVNVFAANYDPVVSPNPRGYGYDTGTSLATPIASGVAALLLSVYPNLTNDQARYILLHSSSNSNSPNNDIGYGIVSAKAAISYPNVVYNASSRTYFLNKIFFPQTGFNPANAKINYSLDNKSFTSASLSFDNSLKYSFSVPAIADSQAIYFYYSYQDSSGASVREPAANSYVLKYGAFNVGTPQQNSDTGSAPSNNSQAVLENNFPNPFNPNDSRFGITNIRFTSSISEHAKLIILNPAGQTVKVLFDGITSAGTNTFTWNGRSDKGAICASGVYYYILSIGGKEYGNKLVLIK